MAEKTGLADLYTIVRDQTVGMRNRLNAAVSASRVERLAMPGEALPEAIVFLKHVIDYERDGERFSPQFRREAAAALSYWERRAQKMALTFNVADVDEKRRQWCGIINGAIRVHLGKHGHWPARKDVLFRAGDEIDLASLPDPDLVLSGLLFGGNRRQRRRQRTIDERTPAVWSGTEAERKAMLRPLVQIVHARLKAFGLAG